MNEELRKKYNNWNLRKQDLQDKIIPENIYFKEGDIWWCGLGINIGSESFGKGENFRRPVLILKKLANDLFIGIPITSQTKQGSWFVDITLNSENRCAMLYQIRVVHIKRLQRKIGKVNQKEFLYIKEKLKQLLQLS